MFLMLVVEECFCAQIIRQLSLLKYRFIFLVDISSLNYSYEYVPYLKVREKILLDWIYTKDLNLEKCIPVFLLVFVVQSDFKQYEH